eukprot:COSAG06_NODE_149_length_22026_cov_33.454782_12_plen_52_part_00
MPLELSLLTSTPFATVVVPPALTAAICEPIVGMLRHTHHKRKHTHVQIAVS